METKDRIQEFRQFISDNMENEKTSIEMAIKERSDFLKEFPLERIKKLSAEEYCLGTEKSKESLCYLLEFGKYKHTGFGIGGGSAKKYGIYYNKGEQCYKRGTDRIDNIEVSWTEFRDELYRFLTESGEADHPLNLDAFRRSA